MNKKIKHPFQVPEEFFDEFKSEFLSRVDLPPIVSKQLYFKKMALNILKYAAIIAFAFLLGRYSMVLKNQNSEVNDFESIISQVSEDEIVNFVIEDELLNEL